MQSIGKVLVVLGVVLAGIGLVFMLSGKIPFLGRLPGDIVMKRDNFQFYFPVTSSIVVSILLTVIVWIFSYIKGK